MKLTRFVFFAFSPLFASSLFEVLEKAEEISIHLNSFLPTVYNSQMITGYSYFPSARMEKEGEIATGGGYYSSFASYGISAQFFPRMQASFSYTSFAPRHREASIGNIKCALNLPEKRDLSSYIFPVLAGGWTQSIAAPTYQSLYFVATQLFSSFPLEISAGWGSGNLKKGFGALSFFPWHGSSTNFLQWIGIMVEGSLGKSKEAFSDRYRVQMVFATPLQLALTYSPHSKRWGGSARLSYPLGRKEKLIGEKEFVPYHQKPKDKRALSSHGRTRAVCVEQLVFSFNAQDIDIEKIAQEKQVMQIWIANNSYRSRSELLHRIQQILSALLPAEITQVIITLQQEGIDTVSYRFSVEDMEAFSKGYIGEREWEHSLIKEDSPFSPLQECWFERSPSFWYTRFYPRVVSFFGAPSGKFAISAGACAQIEGYIASSLYYQLRLAYDAVATPSPSVQQFDTINPSYLPEVRTDSLRYYKGNQLCVEAFFLQKNFHPVKDLFVRCSVGYFEAAYAGVGWEMLYAPLFSSWALGIEQATVWKRNYTGLGCKAKIRQLKGSLPCYIPFTGLQGFINLYKQFSSIGLETKLMAGYFLGRDIGARLELRRIFKNGLALGVWYTVTNAQDKVNGSIYHDKGISFSIPLDLMKKKRSNRSLGSAFSLWLRDEGAAAYTGTALYPLISGSRP